MKIRTKLCTAVAIVVLLTISCFAFVVMDMVKTNVVDETVREQWEYYGVCKEFMTTRAVQTRTPESDLVEGHVITMFRDFVNENKANMTRDKGTAYDTSLKYAIYNAKQDRYWFNSCGYNPHTVLHTRNKEESIIIKIDGKVILFLSDWVEHDLQLFTAKDITEKYTYLDRIRNLIIFTGAILCVATVLVTFFLTRRMLRSIKRMENFVKKLGDGEYGAKVDIRSHDEIREFGDCFNEMSARIAENMDEKEQEIENREILINALSHELKTPVTSIKGCAQTLLYTKISNDQQEEILQMMDKECTRMEKLSQKMMQLLIIKKMDDSTFEDVALLPLLERLKTNMENIYVNKNLQVVIDCQCEKVHVDEDLFYEMIANFVDNAGKACGENGQVRITVTEGRMSIEDNGCGMEAEHLSKIQMPFYMVDKARSRRNNGVGLGLAICSKIVELHGFRLEITSEPGHGTKVMIYNLLTK